MALKVLQPGGLPLGQFDALDSLTSTILGGEVLTLTSVLVTDSDKSAADQADGYIFASGVKRPYANLPGSTSALLFLADDGTSGYGTLFGTVVGGTVGKQVTGGAVLGPNTAAGSGKITLWQQPGLYGVTLDATSTTVKPGQASLDAGAALYTDSSGKLTTSTSHNSTVVGRFVEFATDGTLVNTPNRLVSALNSPSGNAALATTYTMAVFAKV